MPFFEFKKNNVFYHIIEKDTQDAIIFIHGSGESSYSWKEQIKGLDLNYNLIALDLPSHGMSSEFKKLSLELYVETVKTLVKHLSLRKVILVGHSLGGAVALSYYFKYSQDISGLILCGTGARLRVSQVIFDLIKNNFDEYLETIPVGCFYRKTPKEIVEDYVEEVQKVEPEVSYIDFSICNEFDVMDKIDSIRVPCLIICGNADKLTPIKYSQFFNEKIRNSTLSVIQNAGHMVMLEKPELVNQNISLFTELT